MSALFSVDYMDRAWHEETMLQTALDFAARVQPNYSLLLLVIAILMVVGIVLLLVLLAVNLFHRQRNFNQNQIQPPAQIHLHLNGGDRNEFNDSGNSAMARLSADLAKQKQKRLSSPGNHSSVVN